MPLLLAIPASCVELFRYRVAAKDGGTLECIFDASETECSGRITKEKTTDRRVRFQTLPHQRKLQFNAKFKVMAEPTDLRTICSALEHFFLPAALCNIKDNAFVVWNQAFQKRAELSEEELAQAQLKSLLLLDESYGGSLLQHPVLDHVVRFVPCVFKKPVTDELVHGRALRRNDGCLLAMLDLPTGDAAFEGFIHGRFVGREEERNRTRQFFHDILSSKILVASFIAHEIYQSLAASGADEVEEMGRVTKLLRETIHDISHGFEEPTIQAKFIPEPEAESLKRLLS